jgi:hypothetical protein
MGLELPDVNALVIVGIAAATGVISVIRPHMLSFVMPIVTFLGDPDVL